MKKIIDEKTKKEIYELEKARKNTNNKKEEVRLKAMILKLQGVTTREISEKLDVAMSTIFEWLRKYKKSSIDGLKNKKRIGNNRNLTFEEEKEFLRQFEERAEKGQIITAKEIEKAYRELVGHSIGNGQIYYVLKRHGFRKIMPRSRHPKKANEEAIEASKKLNPK
ncbi:helix-turn-helix domain-containing protein [Anaerococcus sp. WCA-380-WT-2B]|uniref:Helix-turn-helix domain-containing protein n=4 Tax=Anaerococcus TaxID=165779 RepID=A0A6N7VE98_9FIRM|nr:helix-turn-helix domain-containing protein [Anaerococcus porci]MSS77778.1 helix-turn-helix domain-containing protein [Anaerococcus porci]